MGWGWGMAGPLLHLLCLASVFDIHFKSPLVDSPLHAPPPPRPAPPARRLVLFVADGLRAESFYQQGAAPYLHSVAGVHSISHTAVPTESRPGHVAMLAGVLEDPSAITRGWTENPVTFDSVLNRSSHAWSWGSPDILPMFARGAPEGRVTMEMYDAEFEDFSSSDSAGLDRWVFQRVFGFLDRADSSPPLAAALRAPAALLFLHLLGCDTNGHVNKPRSREYSANIATVDQGVRATVEQLEEFFGHDGGTAYVFTSDHGMTDWGSHGTGMAHETVTPLVVWGAGAAADSPGAGYGAFPALQGLRVEGVRQVDLAPLMASLLGVPVPRHSTGRLPRHLLAVSREQEAAAMAAVVEQLGGQFRALRAGPAGGLLPGIFHAEFPNTGARGGPGRPFRGRQVMGVEEMEKEVTRLQEGIVYYQRYQATILARLTVATYTALIATNLGAVGRSLGVVVLPSLPPSLLTPLAALAAAIATVSFLCQTHLPLHLLLYYLAPVLAWHRALATAPAPERPVGVAARHLATLLLTFLTLASIAAAFHERRWLSLGLLLPALHLHLLPSRSHLLLPLLLLLATFPWLPAVDGRFTLLPLVVGSGALLTALHLHRRSSPTLLSFYPLLSSLCVLLSSLTTHSTLLQAASWLLLLTSLPLALCIPHYAPAARGGALSLALTSTYLLLALSYEAVFLPVVVAVLEVWCASERSSLHLTKEEEQGGVHRQLLTSADVLCIVSFVFLNFYSFFATGNIASLNSFDPSSIRCLVAVFSPFLMGGLLLLKVLVPFLVVSIAFLPVLSVRGLAREQVLAVVQLCSDCMGLHFFLQVTHTGSWLEIGTSLSHYVIVEGSSLAITLLVHLADMLYRVTL